jgi:hypothetical protein
MIRAVLVVALAALALSAPARGETRRVWTFDVYLGDQPIGSQRFEVLDAGDRREMRTQASFDVKLWILPDYRYRHRNEESWRGRCLDRIESTTEDGGTQHALRGRLDGSSFALAIDARREVRLPDCIMTFAYWDPEILRQKRLLNSQTGEYLPVTVAPLATTRRGSESAARGHRLTAGETVIDVWYDADGRWIGLESTTKGGQLRYVMR